MKKVEPRLRQASQIHVECRLEIPDITWGTSDVVLLTGTHITLIDYKFGKWVVDDPKNNMQAKAYTLGAFHKFPEAKTAEFIFLTPRHELEQSSMFEREEAMGWTDEFKTIVERADDPSSPYRPDSENCLFCGTKARCPELQKRAMNIAEDYDGLLLPESAKTAALTDPAQLQRALDVASIMERWAKNVRNTALELRLEGVEIPGYELKQTAGNRKIKDVTRTWSALKEIVPQEEFLEACSITIGTLEKKLKEQAPRGQKQEFAKSTLEVLDGLGLIERGRDKTYLTKQR
tara:strand:- start:170 stop:1039 length:870 start_codon:yes stop_codon:yes gene_type:complete